MFIAFAKNKLIIYDFLNPPYFLPSNINVSIMNKAKHMVITIFATVHLLLILFFN